MIQMLNNIIRSNNQIEFMDLPGWSIYGPIKDFYLRNPLEGVVHEKKIIQK